MKTILIPIFHPLDARNILRTDVWRVLIECENVKIVLLVPESKSEYYRINFQERNVLVETVPELKEKYLARFLRLSARMMLDTGSMYWQARIKLENTKNYREYLYSRLVAKIGRFKLVRDVMRFCFQQVASSDFFSQHFIKYSPDLIFLSDIYSTADIYLGLEAKKRKVLTVGMVRSWDNITSKGACLFLSDKLIVHNEDLKEQAKGILGVAGKDIEVTGLPHFDYYADYKPTPKKRFISGLGLPVNCRYLLFVPYLGTYKQGVNEILQILDAAIGDGRLPADLKIVVRMPPSYNANFNDTWTSGRIFMYYPGHKLKDAGKSEWEFTEADMIHYADELVYASVVLSFASTVTIDAAALNRPVINIGFDGYTRKDFPHSIQDIYIVDHFASILASNGTPLVRDIEGLILVIRRYLDDPTIDTAGRAQMVREQCSKVDGRSGSRLARYLLYEMSEDVEAKGKSLTKRILIPLFQGQVARNIFQTDVMLFLSGRGDTSFLFVVPPEKIDYYRENYTLPNVSFTSYNKQTAYPSGKENIIRALMFFTTFNQTKFINITRDYKLNPGLRAGVKYAHWFVYLSIAARFAWMKKMLRSIYARVSVVDRELVGLFRRENIGFLYLPNLYDSHSMEFTKAAREAGVKVIATVNSWDNLSTRGLIPSVPDRLLVQNEYMREEAMKDHLIDPRSIIITGLPQFDYYAGYRPSPKERFFQSAGIADTDKKIILFAPPPLKFGNPFWEVLKKLDHELDVVPGLKDFVVLVRFYPNDDIDVSSFVRQHALGSCRNLFYSLPCTNNFGGGVNFEFNQEDMIFLADSICYSYMVINYGSTLNIDAAAFDKPVINVKFGGGSGFKGGGLDWAYGKTHIQELLKTSGVRIANNYEELVEYISDYASDPSLDGAGREQIRRRFCYRLDGRSSRRLAEGIASVFQQDHDRD